MPDYSHRSTFLGEVETHVPITTTATSSFAAATDQPSGSVIIAPPSRADEACLPSVLSQPPTIYDMSPSRNPVHASFTDFGGGDIHDSSTCMCCHIISNLRMLPGPTREKKRGLLSGSELDQFRKDAFWKNKEYREKDEHEKRASLNRQDESVNSRDQCQRDDYDEAMQDYYHQAIQDPDEAMQDYHEAMPQVNKWHAEIPAAKDYEGCSNSTNVVNMHKEDDHHEDHSQYQMG